MDFDGPNTADGKPSIKPKALKPKALSVDARKSKSVRESPKYGANPFMADGGIVIKTKSKRITVARGGQIRNPVTDEIEGVTEIAQIINVEKAEFIKIFTKDIAVWFDLNRTAFRVFAALLMIYQKDGIRSDLVYFHHEDERIKDFKIRKASWFLGLEELLNKGFLARQTRTNWYYINLSMFFNGDRARFVKEYRIGKTKRDPNTIDLLDGKTDAEKLEESKSLKESKSKEPAIRLGKLTW